MKIFLDGCESHWIVKRLIPEWEVLGVGVSNAPKGCDVQLSLIAITSKRTGLPMVLRLDGVYYDKATDYKVRNERISNSHTVADAIIYQSEFCKIMCWRYLTPTRLDALRRIIYNGVRRDWAGVHEDKGFFDIVVSARWRRHKRLPEIEEVFWEYCKSNDKARLHVFGDTLEHERNNHPFITYYGHCAEEQMVPVFARASAMLHLSKKDCCPNSVVEAIAAGVPTITTSACGGTVELCRMTKGCFVVSESGTTAPCYPYTDEYNALSDNVRKGIVFGLEWIKRKVIGGVKQPEELTIEHMAREYLKVFREVQ